MRLSVEVLGMTLDDSAPAIERAVMARRSQVQDRCSSDRPERVSVHLHVHPPGRITLARDNPNEQMNVEVARCVANVLRGISPIDGVDPEGSGIVTVTAFLPAR